MKLSKSKLISLVFVLSVISSFELFSQETDINFAYVSIEGKAFSKKLKVTVDLGESPEQIKTGESYSKELETTKSYANVLNYMDSKDFELVEIIMLQENYTYQGTGGGGVTGIVFVMKKKKTVANNG